MQVLFLGKNAGQRFFDGPVIGGHLRGNNAGGDLAFV